MRREDRLDAQPAEQLDGLVECMAALLQPLETVRQATGLRLAAVVEIGATAADAMDLFRHVDHLEPGREGADQVFGLLRRPGFRPHLQLDAGAAVVVATADRELAIPFNFREELVAALIPEHLADQRAQGVHVVAQRRVLGGERYVFAWHDRGSFG